MIWFCSALMWIWWRASWRRWGWSTWLDLWRMKGTRLSKFSSMTQMATWLKSATARTSQFCQSPTAPPACSSPTSPPPPTTRSRRPWQSVDFWKPSWWRAWEWKWWIFLSENREFPKLWKLDEDELDAYPSWLIWSICPCMHAWNEWNIMCNFLHTAMCEVESVSNCTYFCCPFCETAYFSMY